VNFIGHATVALWQRSEPLFVLGSMLPDFASMVGVRLSARHAGPVDVRDGCENEADPLSEGIALHHRTDEVFHSAPQFTRLMQETLEELTSLGVARGAARAVGHIGVEMLIDGELVRGHEVAAAYLEALQAGGHASAPFREEQGSVRWQALRLRLLAFGPPHDYGNLDVVLGRLVHVLQHRPRLALDDDSARLVRSVLPALQQKVVTELPRLLANLQAVLC
jgi:hypothetical protein